MESTTSVRSGVPPEVPKECLVSLWPTDDSALFAAKLRLEMNLVDEGASASITRRERSLAPGERWEETPWALKTQDGIGRTSSRVRRNTRRGGGVFH